MMLSDATQNGIHSFVVRKDIQTSKNGGGCNEMSSPPLLSEKTNQKEITVPDATKVIPYFAVRKDMQN